jgi:hypothetical protein
MSPIQRFRTFEEAEEALWCFEPDVAYWKRVKRLFALAERLRPRRCPRGIFRYRTINEANREATEWNPSNVTSKS